MSDKIIDEIDVKSGPGVFRHFEHLDLRPWYLLGEYIDNAIGSMESNIRELKKINPDYILTVRIFRDKISRKIYITDNAAGISDKEIERALIIGERPSDTSGAHEYGVGMKMASFHFTKRWSIRTSALGESVEKYIDLDVDEIENTGNTTVAVQRQSKKADISFTEICLENFYDDNWPKGATINKIERFLSSMYRRYIDQKKLVLIFDNGDKETYIEGSFPDILNMHFVKDKNKTEKEWKQDISFKYKNKTITGWVGLLQNTGALDSGFDLIRRNKVIEGDENAWKPDSKDSPDFNIFDGGHSNARSRLFGELIFKGFQTNNNKSKIKWNSLEDDVKEEFLKYLFDLIKIDKTLEKTTPRDERLRDFWYQLENYISFKKKEEKSLKKIVKISQDIISAKLKIDHANFSFPDADDDENTDHKINYLDKEDNWPEFNFPINETEDREWLINVIPTEGPGDKNWFEYEAEQTSDWPKQIKIRWDVNHTYSIKVFKQGEDSSIYQVIAPAIFKIISYLVIAEEKLRDLDRDSINDNIGRSYYRDYINKALKLHE